MSSIREQRERSEARRREKEEARQSKRKQGSRNTIEGNTHAFLPVEQRFSHVRAVLSERAPLSVCVPWWDEDGCQMP